MLARSRPFRSAECDEPFPPPLAGEGRVGALLSINRHEFERILVAA
jgi:hypothetical protein